MRVCRHALPLGAATTLRRAVEDNAHHAATRRDEGEEGGRGLQRDSHSRMSGAEHRRVTITPCPMPCCMDRRQGTPRTPSDAEARQRLMATGRAACVAEVHGRKQCHSHMRCWQHERATKKYPQLVIITSHQKKNGHWQKKKENNEACLRCEASFVWHQSLLRRKGTTVVQLRRCRHGRSYVVSPVARNT